MARKLNLRGMPEIKREIVTIDASGKVVGRLATHIAKILIGKDKPTYVPHIDAGAIVKVLNADKLVLTGKKMEQKVHFRSSNRPSGVKATSMVKLMKENPGEILVHAVKYMLPKNRTQDERLKRLIIA
ncbi:50S ribosomal protein L13 [Candidatus Uhrbacteria bacterium]|nr:50S ribosomal protein L13 [Candidatus Uhrbacteria bacterium]